MKNSDYNILIVDDDFGVRQSIIAYLQDSGFTTIDTSNALKGIELFQQHQPDLVVTDLRMPGMDGLTFLKNLHEVSPNHPVIVISGAGIMDDVVRALRLGATDYLIKPIIDMEVMVMSIRRSLERSHLILENQRYREKLELANSNLKQHIDALEQDQKAGCFVQQSMLPQSPFIVSDYTFELQLIPALYLSGDCIDYTFLNKRYLAFYLADVSGHGSAPAFVTMWLKHLISQLVRSKRLLADFDSIKIALQEVLGLINHELFKMNLNNHVTMIAGIIDTKSHELFYVVAGHLPLPVLVDSKSAHFLEGSGKPIGVFDSANWLVHSFQIKPGQSLMVFSDGILEILEGNDTLQQEKNLLELSIRAAGNVTGIDRLLNLNAANDMPDDIAMLSISR